MTARIIVPILPGLMEDVVARDPALRHAPGNILAGNPRFAIAIYRAAVTMAAKDSVGFKRK